MTRLSASVVIVLMTTLGLFSSSPAIAISLELNAGIASDGSRAILVQDQIPSQRTATTFVLGLAARTREGFALELDWLRGLSSENYALDGAGGRQTESIVGAAAWLDAPLSKARAVTPFAGLGGRYSECEATLEIGSTGPQTQSVERGVSVRLGADCWPHRRIALRGWLSEGWVHGTGDNRATGYRFEWSMLSPGAGVELRFLAVGGGGDRPTQ